MLLCCTLLCVGVADREAEEQPCRSHAAGPAGCHGEGDERDAGQDSGKLPGASEHADQRKK